MKLFSWAVIVFGLLLLSGCVEYYRFSAEAGTSIDLFTESNSHSDYGTRARNGIASLMGTDLNTLKGGEVGASIVRWSGPYTNNTLAGANFGYSLVSEDGFFGRASIGPYYGDRTERTASRWVFGINTSIGVKVNKGRNEVFISFWHFSNGSDLGIGQHPNLGEEFLNAGFSFLF